MKHDAHTERIDDVSRAVDGLRAEMTSFRSEMNQQLNALRTELGGQMNDLRTDVGSQLNDLRTDLSGQMNDLRTDLGAQTNDLRRDFYNTRLWMWSMWLGFAAIFVEIALLK